jgi:flavin-binding protein dodecin
MNIRLIPCVVLTAAGLLQSCTSSAPEAPPITGGYAPVEFIPGVKEAAEFAVKAQSKKERKTVKFFSIVQSEMQVVAGRNYRFELKVTQGKKLRTAKAVVYQSLDSRLELTSWEWVTP